MFRKTLAVSLLLLSLIGCSNIDCPLDNQVLMTLNFVESSTQKKHSITDTLSVYGLKNGSQHLLFNKGIKISSMQLPLNQASDKDTLLLTFANTSETETDTLIIDHARQAHFESLDCPAATFHTIRSLMWKPRSSSSSLLSIDSVIVTHPNVQYEDVENLKVYLHTPVQ